jgi:sugar (pentulose or hexulose) kinase
LEDLSNEAREKGQSCCIIDTEASDFENPNDMISSIRSFAERTYQTVPSNRADITRCIFESLVLQIRWCIEGLTSALGTAIVRIHLIGGGATSRLFCELLSDCLGLPVFAGPAEATMLGNVMTQLIAKGELSSVTDIRRIVKQSSEIREVSPDRLARERWEITYENFIRQRRNSRNVQ